MLKYLIKIRFFLITFFVVLLNPLELNAQNFDLKFEHFIDEKGFTQNSVMKVIQDLDGYIWVGTLNGLYKYDGQNFTVFRHQLNNPNSLVNNSVYELELDHKGNLLIGTENGLSKYNRVSQTFTTYPVALKNARITAIYPDQEGLIVGTLHTGLFYFENSDLEGNNPKNFIHKPNQEFSLSSNQVHSIVKDSAGNIWVGTVEGLDRIESLKEPIKFTHFDNLRSSIKTLYVDKGGSLWASKINHTLIRIEKPETFTDQDSDNYKEFTYDIPKSDTDESGGILTIFEDEDGSIWFGVHGYGLYQFNTKTNEYRVYVQDPARPESISSNNIESILVDNTNVLWVGTEEGGLNKCDLKQKEITFYNENLLSQNSLSNSSINVIAKGCNNDVWVGTQDGLNRVGFKNKHYDEPVFERYFLNKTTNNSKFRIQEHFWSILRDHENDYWIGTTNGIVHMLHDTISNNVSFNETDFKMLEVSSSLEDKNGVLWFGSLINGLIKWDKKKSSNGFDFSTAVHYLPNSNDPYSISAKEISCLYEDSKGNIWVGTVQGGLNLIVSGIKGASDQFMTFKHDPVNKNSLSHNSVFSILEDKDGVFWIGTFGGGLNKMILPSSGSSDPIFKYYSEEDGLANDAIYGILEDDNGLLWISTDNGISSFNPKTEVFKNFSKEDGLQSNNFRLNAYYKGEDGYLFFGGLKGLNIFHPNNLMENDIKAPVVLTSFKIKNETVEIQEEFNGRVIFDKPISHEKDVIVLDYHENTLSFEFAALHYAAPDKNRFKYKLEGFDKDWVDSKELSFAHYTNLSTGNYTFKVKASNNDGLWNDEAAVLKLRIKPPFWLTWWAFVIYGIIFLGVLLGAYSYLDLRSKQRMSLQVQKEIEKVNKLKLQFFTNISHEFKTPITLILNPIEELLESKGFGNSARSKLKVVHRNANSLLRLVHQLMEFRRIEVGETKLAATNSNIISFVREITFSFRATVKKKEIKISFDSEVYDLDVWFDWDKLEKILNNLIYNAIKFTPKGGHIKVKIKSSGLNEELDIAERGVKANYLQIDVEDNGVGIEKDQLQYIFQRFYQVNQSKEAASRGSGIGLAFTKDLVDLHHGVINVKSKRGEGTCFSIKLPLGKDHLLEEEIAEPRVLDTLDENKNDPDFSQGDTDITKEDKHKKTVLVVDDNEDIRIMIKEGLSNVLYNIIEAENGKEALDIALKEMPDIVVSDVLMPEMDGIAFCHKIKNNIRTSHIPVILLTALNSVEHRIKGIESGADAYIPKPFRMKLLSVRVKKLIASKDLLRKSFQTEKELIPEKVKLSSVDDKFLKDIMTLMESNMANESYWVDELAHDLNISRSTLFRKLKKLTGQTPNDFMRVLRLKRGGQLLEQNERTISEISYMVGFSDPNYFGKCFRKFYGETPSNYIKTKGKEKKMA